MAAVRGKVVVPEGGQDLGPPDAVRVGHLEEEHIVAVARAPVDDAVGVEGGAVVGAAVHGQHAQLDLWVGRVGLEAREAQQDGAVREAAHARVRAAVGVQHVLPVEDAPVPGVVEHDGRRVHVVEAGAGLAWGRLCLALALALAPTALSSSVGEHVTDPKLPGDLLGELVHVGYEILWIEDTDGDDHDQDVCCADQFPDREVRDTPIRPGGARVRGRCWGP